MSVVNQDQFLEALTAEVKKRMGVEWVIRRNVDRYGELGKELPDIIVVSGTEEQAEALAERLSNYYPGCDFLFYVENGKADAR